MKKLIGIVEKKNSNKTLNVIINKFYKNLKYKKYLKKTKFYKVHDEYNLININDNILFKKTNKISKTKFYKIIYVI